MGLRDDKRRFEKIGEDHRVDLADFIDEYEMKPEDDTISVPIKRISLPEFVYAKRQQGGIGQGEGAEEGDPVEAESQDGEGDGDDAGEGEGEHEYYQMSPEEFAEQMDERFELDLDPKGKQVVNEIEGDFTDVARTGPDSTLDIDHLYKEGLKRTLAMNFDADYLREVMRVDGMGPDSVFTWARDQSMAVSKQWVEAEYEKIENRTKYDSIDDIDRRLRRQPATAGLDDISIQRRDERYRHPEIIEEYQKNVVVVNIRDVSGSMGKKDRKMVESVFTPLDWYLRGKYDHAEFIYIAHDATAWECEREEFFTTGSGGGTKVSSAYELAQDLLEDYPFSDWNRYVFGAGDGDNRNMDTDENLVPLIDSFDVNMHGYIEVGQKKPTYLTKTLTEEFDESVVTTTIEDRSQSSEAVKDILLAASEESDDT